MTAPLTAFAAAPALALALWRNGLGACALGPVVAVKRGDELRGLLRKNRRRELRYSVFAGVALATHFATFMPSTQLTSVTTAAALVSTQPIWQGLISVLLGRKLPRSTWVGTGIAVLGAVVATGGDFQVQGTALLGDLLALVGAVAVAVYTELGGQVRATVSTPSYSVACFGVSTVVLLVVCLVGGIQLVGFDTATWLAVLGLLLLPQMLGLSMLNFVLGRVSAITVSLVLLMEAPVAAFIAWIWLGQVPSETAVTGMFLVIAGVAVVVIFDARTERDMSQTVTNLYPAIITPVPVPSIKVAPPPMQEVHSMIWNAAHGGRHHEAMGMVALLEQGALRTYGPASPEAIHWIEVRAQLARVADDPSKACELWLVAAASRLSGGEPPDAEEVVAAVDRATHEWARLHDSASARYLAPKLIAMRRQIPGSDEDEIHRIERRLSQVHAFRAPPDPRLEWADKVKVSQTTRPIPESRPRGSQETTGPGA
ncbi:DMT family transporter [Streptomyces sp. NA02950]|nr:DMT family transporter [Streptomyces sp. NA02950]